MNNMSKKAGVLNNIAVKPGVLDRDTRVKAVAMAKKKGIHRTLTLFDVSRKTLRRWMV